MIEGHLKFWVMNYRVLIHVKIAIIIIEEEKKNISITGDPSILSGCV